MAWHVVYRNSTGAAVSEGPTKPLKVPSGFTLKTYAARPDPEGKVWDPGQTKFVARPVPVPTAKERRRISLAGKDPEAVTQAELVELIQLVTSLL